MGFFDSVVAGIGGVVAAVGNVFKSMWNAVTGGGGGTGGGGAPNTGPPMSRTTPAAAPVEPCPIRDGKACPGVLSSAAETRANAKYDKLSADEKAKFKAALDACKSPCERAYIWKAFAACHTPDECAAFGQKISGKSDKWMKDNLSLTGDSNGKGVQQQWSHSCNATTAQAVRGQMDPVYALQVHEENPNMGTVDGADATKQNPKLAEEQRAALTSEYVGDAAGKHSGVAASRDNPDDTGSGRWADDLFNKSSDASGVTYKTQKDPADPMPLLDNGLATGAPVPIVIGNGPGEYTHYVLVTASDPGPPKTYTIHDPWDGVTVTRSEQDVKDGKINLAGSNQITAVEVPTAKPRPPEKPPC